VVDFAFAASFVGAMSEESASDDGAMKIIGITGLVERGYSVSTIKHAHHSFDIDTPGKDSFEHRRAGATEVLVTSASRWALIHENRERREPSLWEMIERLDPVDLLIVEGYKREGYDKLEVYRPNLRKPMLAPDDDKVVAILSDMALPEAAGIRGGLPVLDLNDLAAIADYVVAHCGLAARENVA
jgi:molybdopterin-guanine dinucleotide biosynthesis protein B